MWPLLLSISILLLACLGHNVFADETERAAVVSILSKIPDWIDDGSDHCGGSDVWKGAGISYNGIFCDDNGHVVRVTQANCGMSALSPSIGLLPKLTSLTVRNNLGVTTIPPEIGQLPELSWLDASECGIVAIPPEIGQLASLTHLNLGENSITGAVPDEILSITTLTDLSLLKNSITSVPARIAMMPNLVNLNLAANEITFVPLIIEGGPLRLFTLASNALRGGIPASVSRNCCTGDDTNCRHADGLLCDFGDNPFLCNDGTRYLDTRLSCAPCPNCVSGGTCAGGFEEADMSFSVDGTQGSCDVCPLDTFESSEGECRECAGSVLSSVAFPLVFAAAAAMVGGVLYLLRRKLPAFHLSIVNMIRIKQLAAVLQVLQVFAGLSTLLAVWFGGMSAIASKVSLPFELNPVCIVSIQTFTRAFPFVSAWVTVAGVAVVVSLLLNAHRIPLLRGAPPIVFKNLQSLAALVVIQAALVVLPTTIKAQDLAYRLRDIMYDIQNTGELYLPPGGGLGDRVPRKFEVSEVLFVVASILTMLMVVFGLNKVTRMATHRYGALRKKVLEDLDSVEGGREGVLAQDKEKEKEDVEQWRHFYASFCMQYSPAGLRQEEHAVIRKLAWIVATKLVEVAEILAYESKSQDPGMMPPVATAMRCAAIVFVNLQFAKTLLDRPYISFRRSERIGDPSNDAELMATRVLSWGAAALSVKVGLTAETDGLSAAVFMDLVCAAVVVGLLLSQRPLFRGALDVVRDAALGEGDKEVLERHSGVNEEGSGRQIAEMMESDSFREIIFLQSQIRVEGEEGKRWKPDVNEEGDLVVRRSWAGKRWDALGTAGVVVGWLLHVIGCLVLVGGVGVGITRCIVFGADSVVWRWCLG
ncbi:hypothetical protein TeGR_g2342 [Tetraparma gracilis]|uniref:Uncharacterized protein n=1 Tax=Tetraparma gracilis TaxID=2962635 RepID=A0ABQ6N7L1_9STRA|nr:hypothetical protein TeGR_g2342 [Tetraparma gracilis]